MDEEELAISMSTPNFRFGAAPPPPASKAADEAPPEAPPKAVEFLDERTTRIYNMRNGRVTQVIINVLSEDGNTIENEYVRLDEDGMPTGVGHATYRRISD